MILVNFGHPLTPEQLAAADRIAGRTVDRLVRVDAQFDPGCPLGPQATALVARAGLTPDEWQTAPLLLNLPGHSALAAAVLAEVHGLCGHFPAVLRLRPAPGSVPAAFEVAEIVDLQSLRDAARSRRSG